MIWERRRSGRETRQHRMVWALTVLAVLVAGVAGGCSNTAVTSSSSTVCNATSVADKVLPSVVTISTTNGTSTSSGSGDIIRSDGHILTNNHVVSLAAGGGTIEVVFADGASFPASITGRDPKTDLAVIKIEAGASLPAIALGSSGSVRIGAPVVVLGSPLGLSSTVTAGIVSALDRTIEVPSDNGQSAVLISALQTDAAINPGNSGGALTNCAGELIGVPSANATVPSDSGETSGGSIGLGFAIPIDLAKAVADEIIATGTVTHSYFGVEVVQVPPAAATQGGKPEGLFVTAVVPGGPAEASGLRPGDVITAIDGQAVTDPDQLALLTLTKKPGESVTVTYEREGKSAETMITLGTQP
jgi:putative serine protease PepD